MIPLAPDSTRGYSAAVTYASNEKRPMSLRKRFGERLKFEREGKGLTQSDLGPQPYVSAVERGLKRVTLDQVEHFASLLRCDPAFLLTEPKR